MPPTLIQDPVLGPCTWNAKLDWYECTPFKADPAVTLSIQALTFPTLEAAWTKARELVGAIESITARAKAFAAADLLETFNSEWRDDGEPEITAAEFANRMTLQSVDLSATRLTLYFDDGDLFLGHCLEIRINPDGTMSEACVSG
jgi:hypothetical protein